MPGVVLRHCSLGAGKCDDTPLSQVPEAWHVILHVHVHACDFVLSTIRPLVHVQVGYHITARLYTPQRFMGVTSNNEITQCPYLAAIYA